MTTRNFRQAAHKLACFSVNFFYEPKAIINDVRHKKKTLNLIEGTISHFPDLSEDFVTSSCDLWLCQILSILDPLWCVTDELIELVQYCYMMDYGSHFALYIACSGIDALMLLEKGRMLGAGLFCEGWSILSKEQQADTAAGFKEGHQIHRECLLLPLCVLTWYMAPTFAPFLP